MPTILVIEDDCETAGLLKEALNDLGYAVDLCEGGDEGLRRIQDSEPDLVICDVRMPGMTGFELLKRISSGRIRPIPPFLFLTALSDRDSELAGRRLGADDYLPKPIDFEILATVVANCLRHKEALPATKVTLTDREREVLTWVGRGKTSYEIALILGVRERTVNFHCDQAMRRLDASNRTQAAAQGVALGLIRI